MSLLDRQREELNRSILAYFKSQNLQSSYKVLSKELAIDQDEATDSKYRGLLEKKWTSVIRLQKKVMDLEQSLSELRDSIPAHHGQANGKIDLTTWTPRAPSRYTLTGHRLPITSIAFHPSYSVIATSSEDSSIKIWDWETGDFEKTLKSHTKAITALDFSPLPPVIASPDTAPSIMLVSCSNDITIKLWDASDEYKCVRTLQGHDHVVSSVKFVPTTGTQIVSVSRDRCIKLWEVATGFCIKTISNAHGDWIRCLSPSFDGQFILTAGSDQLAKVFDLTSADCKLELRGHEHVIECAVYAPPSSFKYLCAINGIAVTKRTGYIATGSRDKTIKLWNAENGVCIATLTGHDNWLRALVFHPDGKFLLSAGDDKTIRVWDLEQGCRCVRVVHDAHGHFISCMAWGLSPSQVRETQAVKGRAAGEEALLGTRSTYSATATTTAGYETGGRGDTNMGKGRYVVATGGIDQVVRIWLP